MILIIRGHIRNSFDNLELFEFIKTLYNSNKDLKIYIHTWNIYANNLSWRFIETNNNIVTKEKIYEYFGEFKELIEDILIDDDTKINLFGKTEGYIHPEGFMPLRGWKNYWYGKYQVINHIFNNIYKKKLDLNEMVINFRFDIFSNYNTDKYEKREVLEFIEKNSKNNFSKNIFLKDQEFFGVDNIYIGNIYTMYRLTNKFFYFLDDILKIHNNTIHQEFLVFRVNNYLFE